MVGVGAVIVGSLNLSLLIVTVLVFSIPVGFTRLFLPRVMSLLFSVVNVMRFLVISLLSCPTNIKVQICNKSL